MATLDDLEAQLREGLDRGVDPDIITVYGDQLQALDDPRGELIAIDLEIAQSGGTPMQQQRRNELIDSWLGRPRPNGTIRYGFIDLDCTSADPVAQVRVALGGPAARFIRSVTAVGPPKLLRETVAAVSELPRPWVVRVTLRQWSEKSEPTIDRQAAVAFAHATPHLQRLEIDARHLFADLSHPALRRLRISGFDAIDSLATGTLSLPQLTDLDLALQCHLATARTDPARAFFEHLGEELPELTSLDLSRNEHGFLDPHTLGGKVELFELLTAIPCRDRLTSLAMIEPDGPTQIGLLRAALTSMTALRELVFCRVPERARAVLKMNLERPGLELRFRA